jgi:hypothetical protein
MAVYCFSYDLNKQGQDYNSLYEEIKRTECLRILDSTWLVSTTETATQLRDRLRQRMDSNDSMFISKVNQGQYDGWIAATYWTWLSARL